MTRPIESELAEALRAFVNIRDQMPQSLRLIQKTADEFAPITVTVTKGQFLAAWRAVEAFDRRTTGAA